MLKSWENDSFSGTTTTPIKPAFYSGNRRPSVDGFIGFQNLQARDNNFTAPLTIRIKFSLSGENVFRGTFAAKLNGGDITALFAPSMDNSIDSIAVLDLGSTPLEVGRNVLQISVDGVIPGTSRIATDIDRLTLTVSAPNSVMQKRAAPIKHGIEFRDNQGNVGDGL